MGKIHILSPVADSKLSAESFEARSSNVLGSKRNQDMLVAWTSGTDYVIAPVGREYPGRYVVDCAGTLSDARAKCDRHWNQFWSLLGIASNRPIRVTVEE
jgi:hypothetical protein